MFQPWLAHHFPGLKPSEMIEIPWSTYLAMWDSVKDQGGVAASGAIRVEGIPQLDRAFREGSRKLQGALRDELRHVGEPVQMTAERFAVSKIRNVHDGDRWAGMRLGFTRGAAVMYVAPKARRRRGSAPGARRPNFATLLLERAMQPALDAQQGEIVRRLEHVVDGVVERMGGGL